MRKQDIANLELLVVDDDEFILKLAVRILRNLGYEKITVANNGNNAIKQVMSRKNFFDVIVSDLNMPDMDGVQLLRHLAEQDFNGSIILLSGEDERMLETAHELAKSYSLDVLGIIPKPLKSDTINALLKSLTPDRNKKKKYQPQTSITEEELKQGIDNGNIQLVFQPSVMIRTGEIVGVETLSRWNHPDRGILGPNTFIPLAESCGLIDEITFYVLDNVLKQASAWLAKDIRLRISINISVNTFTSKKFVEFLTSTVQEIGVDPSDIILEITETQVIKNALECMEILMRIRMKKFGLSIDDFGTGHATMELLKRIPFTELKIDRTFVYGANNNASARAILESSIGLAKKLKMETVAEGVETKEDWNLVKELGCDYVQGYYIAKPLAAVELEAFLKTWAGPH